MAIANLILMVTEDCNFRCGYCYQRRSPLHMREETAREALTAFLPAAADESTLVFGGGEPLLRRPLLQALAPWALEQAAEAGKTLGFSLTTNGSLIDNPLLDFFEHFRFRLTISFDGPLQEEQRRAGTMNRMRELLRELLRRPGISVETNSVFTPRTVHRMTECVRMLLELQVPRITLSLSTLEEWDRRAAAAYEAQLDELGGLFSERFTRRSDLPIADFRALPPPGGLACGAGRDQLAVAADGTLWGCGLFAELRNLPNAKRLYSRYALGRLEQLREWGEDPGPAAHPFARLACRHYTTPALPCFLCKEVDECSVCPVEAAMSGIEIGRVPEHICRLQQARIRAMRRFHGRPFPSRAAP